MKTSTTLRSRMLALVACVLLLAICLASCNPEDTLSEMSNESSETSGTEGQTAEYTVSVKTAGGMAMSEIKVDIYKDNTLADMLDFAKTDESGEVSFSLATGNDYAIVVSGAPKGYAIESSYRFSGTHADIVLTSSLVTDEELSTATLGLGDVMYDFTVTATDGKEIKLSELLRTKDLVVLNFWYTTCSWCLTEFPIMDEVYKEYGDRMEFIAVDPLDDKNAVERFQQEQGLSFPMATCPASWANTFGVSGYPTSVFIDRYGVITLIEAGAITSKRPFLCAMDHFLAENYKQKLCTGGIGDLVTQVKPNYTMDSSEAIGELINGGDIEVTYRPETEDEAAEYIWPFIAGEKLGKDVVYASNKGVDDSYAILYADVTLKKGQAVGFDYIASSERFSDIMYVIVDGVDVYQISGASDNEQWQTCYPCVAEEDGVYEIALCFMKDTDTAEGDDTVYITNMRVVDAKDIDTDTYLPREAASTEDGEAYEYVEIVFNENDGYYHVGTENGPLLLADLMGYSQFAEETTVYDIVYNGNADKDGISLYDYEKDGGLGMVKYFSYASNSGLSGVCTVNKELAEMLKQVAEVAGFDGTENEWLKICKYYAVYGPSDSQLQDPIKGLAPFSAFTTVVGKDVETNNFFYDRAIIPRGLLSEFVPEVSGVYRFTSKSDYQDGIDAWLFDENGDIVYTYEHDERMYMDDKNCSIVYYMEAGKSYYVNMAFWDVYETGTIYYDVEYIGPTFEMFRMASPGYFTYDSDATGETMYDIIAGGITPVLKDGLYYDAEDGSLIYADFIGLTGVFGNSILEMIEMNGFDFSKSETDAEILSYLKQNDNDIEKTKEYLETLWGEEYEANAAVYRLEEVFAGEYHGKGEDYTEEIRTYIDKMDKSGTERDGCVAVDEHLAEILQQLLNKYTFEGVDNAWLKVCYYYDYLGPAN